jgi:hypothetical protein
MEGIRKTYKESGIGIFNMFPSDPTGSLDDFYLWREL